MAEKRSSPSSDEDQPYSEKSNIIAEEADVLENSEERGTKDTKPSTSKGKVTKHICTTCGKCYEYNKDLLHHQRLKHGDGKKITPKNICSVCGKRYVENKDLLRHRRLAHGPLDCDECGKSFKTREALVSHIGRSKTTPCDLCEKTFCSEDDVEMHKRTDHPLQRGGGVGDEEEDEDLEESLEEFVCPPTGHEATDEYERILQSHIMEIKDNEVIKELYKNINRQITPFFTYQNLREMIVHEFQNSNGRAFKVNLGFGFILYNKIAGDYRYYFPSSNSFLFDRAMTIARVGDIDKLMKKILDLDLVNNYYMSRPSSSWTMAGLSNIRLAISYLQGTLIG